MRSASPHGRYSACPVLSPRRTRSDRPGTGRGDTLRHASIDYRSLVVAFAVRSSSVSLSRRELLAGAGAGAAALLLEQRGAPGAADAEQDRRLLSHHRRHRRCRSERRGARGRRRQDRGDRSDRPDPQDVSASRGLRRTRKGAVPGPHQLSRASRGDARARVQRGLRIPQLRAPGRSAQQPPSGRRGDADGHGRCVGSDPHRDHDHRGELRRHQPPRGGIGADRSALRVRRVGPRQRERGRPDVAGGARQE